MKRSLIMGLGVFGVLSLALLLVLLAQMHLGLKNREEVIVLLESELAATRRQVELLQEQRDFERRAVINAETERAPTPAPSPSEPLDVPVAPPQKNSEERAERSALWRAQQFVGEVEEAVALSSEQKDALSEAYKSELGMSVGSSEEARLLLMEKVLGAETTRVFREKQEQAENQERSERLNSEAIVLARKLSLTPEQETQVRDALAKIELSLRPKSAQVRVVMREAMANHMGGDEAKEQLKQQYGTIKQLNAEMKAESDKALFEAIGPGLSDEQKNALLALQAERR